MKKREKIITIIVIIFIFFVVVLMLGLIANTHRKNLEQFNEKLVNFSNTQYGEVMISLENLKGYIYYGYSGESTRIKYRPIYFDIKVDKQKNKTFEILADQNDNYGYDKNLVSIMKIYEKDDEVYINCAQVDDNIYKLSTTEEKGAIKKINNAMDKIDSTLVNNDEISYIDRIPKNSEEIMLSLYDEEVIDVQIYKVNPDSEMNPYLYMTDEKLVGERVHISNEKSFLTISINVSANANYDYTKWGEDITIDFPQNIENSEEKDTKEVRKYINGIDENFLIEEE